MAREATDGLYIELDYYTPENYLTYTAEGRVESGIYIDAGYIAPDYFIENPGSTAFSLTCDLTEVVGELKEFEAAFSVAASLSNDAVKTVDVDSSLNTSATQSVTSTRIRQGACNFGALFTPSISAVAKINYVAILDSSASFDATANRTRDNDIALQNAVNLSLQAAKTASAISALASEFTQTTETARTRDTESLLAVSASVVAQGAAGIIGSATLDGSFAVSVTAQVTIIKEFDATFTSNTSLSADAIQYQLKPSDPSLEIFGSPAYDNVLRTTADSKFGSGSAKREFTHESNVPSIGPIWDGTYWIFYDAYGYTQDDSSTQKQYKSTDLSSWTTTDTDLPGSFSLKDIFYDGTNYVISYANGYYVSTNGTTFTEVDIENSLGTNYNLIRSSGNDKVIYHDGYYYSFWSFASGGTTGYAVARNSSPSASGWTTVKSASSGGATISPIAMFANDDVVAFSYRQNNNYHIRTSTNGTSFSSQNTGSVNPFLITADGTTVYHTDRYNINNGSTSILTGSDYIYDISIVNSKYAITYFYDTKLGSSFTSNASLDKYIATGQGQFTSRFVYDNSTYVYLAHTYDSTTKLIDDTPYVAHSSDASTWTYDDLPFSTKNRRAGLEYTSSNIIDDNWKTIDFWFYIDESSDISATLPLIQFGSVNVNFEDTTGGLSRGRLMLENAYTSTATSGTIINPLNQQAWHHVRVLRDSTGGKIKLYLNGSQQLEDTSYSNSTYDSIRLLGNTNLLMSSNYQLGQIDYLIDDFAITDASLSTYTNSSFTVPTSAYTTDSDTLFYLSFDDTLEAPKVPQTLEGVVVLSSNFELSFDPTTILNGASLQASSGTLTATADTFSNASASLDSSASATADITRVRFAEVSLSSAFTSTVEATKTVTVDSTQSVSATLAVDYLRIRDVVIDTDAVATQLAVVAKVGDFFINIEPAFTQTATAVKRVEADSALSSSFAFTVEVIKVVDAQFSANTTATMPSVDAQRTRSTNSVLDAIATQTATASKTVETAVAINSAFTIPSIDALKFTGNQIALDSAFTQPNTDVVRIRETALNISSAFAFSVEAIKAVESQATINTSATLSIQPLRIRPGVIDTDAIASQLTVVAKVGNGLIALDNAFGLTVTAQTTTGNTVAISAEFTQSAQNDRIRETALDLDTSATQTVDAVISIDANATLNSAFTTSVDARAVKDASATIDGILDFAASVRANLVGEIPLYADTSLSATATVTRTVNSALDAQFTQTTTVTKQVPGSASLSSAFTTTADGRLIVLLEQITFKIPKETRSYSIRSESRGFVINNETRTYKIRG